jgi:hypothetical protein
MWVLSVESHIEASMSSGSDKSRTVFRAVCSLGPGRSIEGAAWAEGGCRPKRRGAERLIPYWIEDSEMIGTPAVNGNGVRVMLVRETQQPMDLPE